MPSKQHHFDGWSALIRITREVFTFFQEYNNNGHHRENPQLYSLSKNSVLRFFLCISAISEPLLVCWRNQKHFEWVQPEYTDHLNSILSKKARVFYLFVFHIKLLANYPASNIILASFFYKRYSGWATWSTAGRSAFQVLPRGSGFLGKICEYMY